MVLSLMPPDKEPIASRVESQLKKKLIEIATLEHRTLSQQIEHMLAQAVAHYLEGQERGEN